MASVTTRGGVVMFLNNSSLRHVMKIDIYHSIGPYEQDEVILYNSNFIDEDTALELVKAGGHSIYVLRLSKKQFEALFLNKEVDDSCLLV